MVPHPLPTWMLKNRLFQMLHISSSLKYHRSPSYVRSVWQWPLSPPASRIVGRGPSLAQMERNAHVPEGGQTGSFKGSAHAHFKKQDTGIGSPKGRLTHQPHPNELKNRPLEILFVGCIL